MFGLIQQGGRVIAKVVPNTQVKNLSPLILSYGLRFDDYITYQLSFHNKGFYGKGAFTTNHIENFWSVVKRGVIGVYHYWSRRHMQKYIDEFVYRANNRELTNREKFDRLLENLEYRLTYKELIYGK